MPTTRKTPDGNTQLPSPSTVMLVAMRYTWKCPSCEHTNWTHRTSMVTCAACDEPFVVEALCHSN